MIGIGAYPDDLYQLYRKLKAAEAWAGFDFTNITRELRESYITNKTKVIEEEFQSLYNKYYGPK